MPPGVERWTIMHFSPRILELVRAYREAESDQRRGPRFKKAALTLEQEMQAPGGVSDAELIECFGPPNLWDEREGGGIFVYFFDHEMPGRDADEWYFHLAGRRVIRSGYNWRGVNDLSSLKTRQDWASRAP